MSDRLAGDAGGGNDDKLFVWPWTGILATATDDDDTHTLAFHARRFTTITTTALQEATTRRRRLHFLVLHFGKSWTGLRDAMSLPGCFAGAGRRQWLEHGENGGVYGWVAWEDDLHGGGVVGRFLGETSTVARSVADVEKAEGSLAAKLAGMAGEKERRVTFLEGRCEEAAREIEKTEEESRYIHDELKELRKITDHLLPEMNGDMLKENGELMEQIEELNDRMIKLDRDEHMNALESNSLDHALRLLETQKRESQHISAKLFQLEKQLEQREALESITRQMNMKLQAGKHLTKEDHQHLYKMMKTLIKNIDQERKRLEHLNLDHIMREHNNRDELRDIHQELVKGLGEILAGHGHRLFKIKKMGELDLKPFKDACNQKYEGRQTTFEAKKLWSSWQEQLKDHSWYPFKIISKGFETKIVVDKDDPKLRSLHLELGNDVCNAVEKALTELNEFNPSGRIALPEVWNIKEGRKATMREIVSYVCKQ